MIQGVPTIEFVESPTEPEMSLVGIRVLVVDDEAGMRTLASTVLAQVGAEVGVSHV